MAGVIPVIDTAYDIVLGISVGFVQWLERLGGLPSSDTSVIRAPEHVEERRAEPKTIQNKDHASVAPASTAKGAVHGKHIVMYTLSAETPLYKNPTIAFDSEIATIPYGALVLVMEPRGRFYSVVWGTYDGWVLKEDLADRASTVYPDLKIGQENSVDHPNTARIRALIGDEFGLAQSDFPLQAGEYVLYRLIRRGVQIVWPEVRPRMPGSWHTILRGAPGVRMSVLPKAGHILEYVDENDIGHLAYVEAVFPDSTITISEANHPHSGIYNERALTKEEWRSLKAIFIEFEPVQKR